MNYSDYSYVFWFEEAFDPEPSTKWMQVRLTFHLLIYLWPCAQESESAHRCATREGGLSGVLVAQRDAVGGVRAGDLGGAEADGDQGRLQPQAPPRPLERRPRPLQHRRIRSHEPW